MLKLPFCFNVNEITYLIHIFIWIFCISATAPVGDQNLSASTRTNMAIERGEALSVVLLLRASRFFFLPFFMQLFTSFCLSVFLQQVNMKHLAKSLQCHLAKPDCIFYGVLSSYFCNLTDKFQICVGESLFA